MAKKEDYLTPTAKEQQMTISNGSIFPNKKKILQGIPLMSTSILKKPTPLSAGMKLASKMKTSNR